MVKSMKHDFVSPMCHFIAQVIYQRRIFMEWMYGPALLKSLRNECACSRTAKGNYGQRNRAAANSFVSALKSFGRGEKAGVIVPNTEIHRCGHCSIGALLLCYSRNGPCVVFAVFSILMAPL